MPFSIEPPPRRLFTALFLLASLVIPGLGTLPAAAPGEGPVILNEVLARNVYFDFDEDGDAEDWVELYNRGSTEADLHRWSLTDDPAVPRKWVFPTVRIPPGGRLRVWLSGKDRFIPPAEAIAAPGGIMVFRPTIIAEGAEWDYVIGDPAAQGPPAGWRTIGFDAAAAGFTPGRSGFGFSDDDDYTILPAGTTTVFIRKVFPIEDPGALVNLILQVDFDDGFVAYLNGQRVAAEFAPPGDPTYASLATGSHEAGAPSRYDLTSAIGLLAPGDNVLALAGLNIGAGSTDLSLAPELGTVPLILHANFKIETDGEYLGLFDPAGALVDEVTLPPQTADHSYGRSPDAGPGWAYLLTPTPEAPNETRSSQEPFSGEVTFRPDPGKHAAGLQVSMAVEPAGISVVRYTTDGSAPTGSSALYTSPIPLSANTVFRAAGFIDGERSTHIASKSYFIGTAGLALPILSISMEPADYVKVHTDSWASGRGSERGCHLELFEPDGTLARSTGMGLRIHGGAGRDGDINTKKAYKAYFRKSYGDGRLIYPLLAESHVVEFDKLVLRSGFNDAFRTNGAAAYLRDQVIRDLHRDMGALAAHGAWYNLFVNMRYRGVFNVTERMDEVFLESYTGWADWDVMKTGNDVLSGDNVEWERLHNYVVGHDLSQDLFYEWAVALLDLENFTSYMILNTWAQNHDWPHNNWYAARPRKPDGKWIFLCWDTEFGLGLIPGGYSADSFEFALNQSGYLRDIFIALLQNARYRDYFIAEVDRHLFFALKPANVLARIDAVQKVIAPDMSEEAALTGNNSSQWATNVGAVRSFASARGTIYRNSILNSTRWKFPAPPRIFACDQAQVVNVGGVTVRLRGVRLSNNTLFAFDGVPAAGAKFITSSPDAVMDVTLPLDLAVGRFPEIAASNSITGQSSSAGGLLEVIPPLPEPTSIEPAEGDSRGGETVRISGATFLDGAAVTFAGVPAAAALTGSPPTIEAVTPPGEGEVEVLVSNRIGGIDFPARVALRFTYVDRGPRFARGDANGDEKFDISDPICILGFLFVGATRPDCLTACDADGSGGLDLSDGIYALSFLFGRGSPPPPPYPGCGLDPTPDALGCEVEQCP